MIVVTVNDAAYKISVSRLRPFQTVIASGIQQAFETPHVYQNPDPVKGGEVQGFVKYVCAVAPTGAGKTVIAADLLRRHAAPCAMVAHRGELVTQISLALAREGVKHKIIGSDSLRRNCVQIHMGELGYSMVEATASVAVCGVDTLINKETANDPWFKSVTLLVFDECHHVLDGNKWGKAFAMFPYCRVVGFTATPGRADGKGIGTKEMGGSGIFQVLVSGPGMRDLIDEGFLTDYRVFCPPSDVDYSKVGITDTGDYNQVKLRQAVHASNTIVGDVVKHYLKLAAGKTGITFAVDVEEATKIAQAYRDAGVPAEVVTGDTPAPLRANIMRKFRNREVLQLVSIDILGEGVDVPACEVVSFVRKTESFGLFVQQWGRCIRLMITPAQAAAWGSMSVAERIAAIAASPKPYGIIIDHVGNVIRHGLPDAWRALTLANRDRRSSGKSDAIPMKACTECTASYERYHTECPFCGYVEEPAARTAPVYVDGDLWELDAETLKALRGLKAAVDTTSPPIADNIRGTYQGQGALNRHFEKQQAQGRLRNDMALFAGYWRDKKGKTDREIVKMFYLMYGVDMMTAQTLKTVDAVELNNRVRDFLTRKNIVSV